MKCKNRLILGSEENTKTSNGDDIIYSLNKKAIFWRGQLSSNFLKHLCRFSFPNIVSSITVVSLHAPTKYGWVNIGEGDRDIWVRILRTFRNYLGTKLLTQL